MIAFNKNKQTSNNNNNQLFPKTVLLSSLTNTIQLTVAQLANLLSIETTEKLTTNDTKAYCTLVYEVDRAKAGYYTALKDNPHLNKEAFLPTFANLSRLAKFAEMKLADFKASIEKLIKHKAVVKLQNGTIFPRREALNQIPSLIINALTGNGKCDINRSFIITKEQLRFLITATKSFALTTLLYSARAIRIVDSVVRLAGSVKVNWLAKLAGVSERTVQRKGEDNPMTQQIHQPTGMFEPYMKRYGRTPEEQLEKNKPLMEWLEKKIEATRSEELTEEEIQARKDHWEQVKQLYFRSFL